MLGRALETLMWRCRALWLLAAILPAANPCFAQKFHEQTFEDGQTHLKLGLTDGQKVVLLDHAMTTEPDQVHAGKQAERIGVRMTNGSFCFAEYSVPSALIFEELSISAWVNATKPGTQLAVRVVLPKVIDPKTNAPTVTMLRGDKCDVANRWRRLMIRRPDELLKRQQELLQAQRKEAVDVRGAYVDMVLFDLFSGIGDVDVRVDDVRLGPIVETTAPRDRPGAAAMPLTLRNPDGLTPDAKPVEVRDRAEMKQSSVAGGVLKIGNRPFFLRGIRRTDAPLAALAEAGVNTAFVDWPIDPALAVEAEKLGIQLVPMLPLTGSSAKTMQAVAARPTPLAAEARGLAIYLGDGLDRASEKSVKSAVDALRSGDGTRSTPITGEVVEGTRQYSRQLDMIATARYPLFSSLDMAQYQSWLTQRIRLGKPGSIFLTWIQTHVPDDFARLVYGHGSDRPFTVPVGPQPEQIKLLTYASIAAGYRGVVFSSDQSLSETAQGRDRMLQLALLDLELSLIEPFLAAGSAPTILKTSHPNVGAALFSHPRGRLVIPYWKQGDAQYVVGQASVNDLNIVVENVQEDAQVFHVSTAEVRTLRRKRDLGGVRIIVPEFDQASIIVLTADIGLFDHYQRKVQEIGPQASAWALELAQIQLAKTESTSARIESTGKSVKGSRSMLEEASKFLADARTASARKDYRMSVIFSDRSRRMVRFMQQQYWNEAVLELTTELVGPEPSKRPPVVPPRGETKESMVEKEKAKKSWALVEPVIDPYLTSFYTLPEHYEFQAAIRRANFAGNQLPTGDFERAGNLDAVGWAYKPRLDDSEYNSSALLIGELPQQGDRSLELKLTAKNPLTASPVVEAARLEMVSPGVPVRAGQIAKITGFVRSPLGISGSVDGAMIWDSIGGETLALRFSRPGQWQKFTLYRPIHQAGELRLHMALTGVGRVHFDDLKVEIADLGPLPLAEKAPASTLR